MAGRFSDAVPKLGRPWSARLGNDLERFLRKVKDSLAGLQSLTAKTAGTAIKAAGGNIAGSSQTPAAQDHVHDIDELDGKGDLLTHDGSTLVGLGVGSDGAILTADASESAGVKWGAFGTQPYPVTSQTGDYTVTDSDFLVLVDASSGNVTITLPASSSGRRYEIKKTDSSANKVIIDGDGSETIDGATTQELLLQYEALSVMGDGSGNWVIV